MLNIPVTLTLGGTDVTVTDLVRKNDVGTYTFSVTVDTDLTGTNVIANILRPDNFKIVDTNVIQTSSSTFDYVLADNAMLYKGMLYIDFSIETIDTSITTPKIAIEIVKPVEAQTVITPADEAVLLGQFMTKQVYDTDGNGIVDNSELLEGQDSAYHLARANHTGTQTASTISDFDTEVSNNTDVVANTAKRSYPLADETKLAGIETGAEVNNISDVNATDLTDGGDSTLHYHATDRARANHTGTQLSSTISDLQTTITNNATVSANNTELVNARTSDTYGAFGSVDARLEASDVILKDLADQLGVKSTLQTQLNETSPIVSVTDSYEGIASPTIHGGSLNQLIVDGENKPDGTTRSFYSVLGISYFTLPSKTFVAGTGASINVTNSTGVNADIMAIPITNTPYSSYTADQMNALVGEYFEGLKSVEKVGVVSRGRNLISNDLGSWEVGGLSTTNGLELSTNINLRTKKFNFLSVFNTSLISYSVKNPTYAKSFGVYFYDEQQNFISQNATTIPNNAKYFKLVIRRTDSAEIKLTEIELAQVMLNEGSTALPYEEYDPSTLTVDVSAQPLHLLPNGVENKLYYTNEGWKYYKGVEEYVLQSADITTLVTSQINVDYVTIPKPANMVTIPTNGSTYDKITLVDGYVGKGYADSLENVNTHTTSSAGSAIIIVFAKGTYANLAAAQADLAGTKVLYQLATPIIIDEADFDTNGVSVEGILTSDIDYTNFYNYNFNIMPIVDIVYDANIASSVQGIKNAIENLKAFQASQNATNLLFDARITSLEP